MGLTASFPPELGALSFLTYITIKNNSFHGPLPIEILNLRRLKLFGIGNNEFSGEIPAWLGQLPRIQRLLLYGNRFYGSIPVSIFNLTSLLTLNLQNNQLSGRIPREVGNLTMLEDLLLDGNQLTEIPSEIGKLGRLKTLNLESNLISGPIPEGVFNLSSLIALDLTRNNFTGGLPDDICENLPALKGLYLSVNHLSGRLPSTLWQCENIVDVGMADNEFTGSIPTNFRNLTWAKQIVLWGNYLSGEIPKEFGNLPNLETLVLQENLLNGTIPSTIFNLTKLRIMSLFRNQLSGTLPPNLGTNLPNLAMLFLGENKLTGSIPQSISNASMLSRFDLSQNLFSGPISPALGNCPNLQWLNLMNNNFSTEESSSKTSIFNFLANLTTLVRLELSYNPLNIFFPNSIANFSASVQYLSMADIGIMGHIPEDIGNLRTLTVLILDDNGINGTIPPSIGKLKQLQGLYLRNNYLEGNIPIELCQLDNLFELFLDNNSLSGALPACFENLSYLKTLSLGFNNFNSTVPSSLFKLSNILSLNLSSNLLTGSLPIDIGNVKLMLDLDVSKNQLSGQIPSSIGDLTNLIGLSLSGNELEGSIPNSFGNLVSLKVLDLSNNKLTGVIPKSLEKLSLLEHFNVSFNQLVGEIPDGGPFSNLSAQSFMSNPGLCADSSKFQVQPCTRNSSQGSKKKSNKLVIILVPTLLGTFLIVLVLLFLTFRGKRKKEQALKDVPLPHQPTLKRITYQELSQATEGFSEKNLIGRGNFGSVYKATLSDGTIAAVKVFNLLSENAHKSFEIECEILCNVRHRNLVKVITNCSNMDFKALVLEFMPKGSLEMWLNHYEYHCNLNTVERLNVMIDVALALEYLHYGFGEPIVHCDLKPSNILLDEDMVAHLTDFGISKLLGGGDSITQTMTLATVGYMAPELGLDGIVSRRGDIYSYGILLMETFTRKKPTDLTFCGGELSLREWVAKSYPHSITDVFEDSALLTKNDETSNHRAEIECLTSIISLALSCTVESPEKRPTAKHVLDSLNNIKTTFMKYERS
uniref:non-specific serine/threonine protein kinase n=1 Tax=Cucumis melo TaxID=3656 RepID=A0A9I9CF62_CUCME